MTMNRVTAYLNQLKINYELVKHPPIFTIDELDDHAIVNKHLIAKNLFLRNDNGKQHYLVTLCQDKIVDLKALRSQIGSSRLGFASEERLMKYIGLTKGSVTPMGVLNDNDNQVIVCVDKDLMTQSIVGVHPNTNEATLWIKPSDMIKAIKHHGNLVEMIDV